MAHSLRLDAANIDTDLYVSREKCSTISALDVFLSVMRRPVIGSHATRLLFDDLPAAAILFMDGRKAFEVDWVAADVDWLFF